jgi:hypothetical protein
MFSYTSTFYSELILSFKPHTSFLLLLLTTTHVTAVMPFTATQKTAGVQCWPNGSAQAGVTGAGLPVIPVTGDVNGLRRCEFRLSFIAGNAGGDTVNYQGMAQQAVLHIFTRNSTAAPSTADTIGFFGNNANDLVPPLVGRTGYTFAKSVFLSMTPEYSNTATGGTCRLHLRCSKAFDISVPLEHIPAADRQSAVGVIEVWNWLTATGSIPYALNWSSVGVT